MTELLEIATETQLSDGWTFAVFPAATMADLELAQTGTDPETRNALGRRGPRVWPHGRNIPFGQSMIRTALTNAMSAGPVC